MNAREAARVAMLDEGRENGGLLEHAVDIWIERQQLRELLVSAEGYALSNGAPFPFVRMFAEDSPLRDVILRAGCYPENASWENPGPLALNPPE